MVVINLLPWRAMAREENAKQRKLFWIVLAGLLVFWLIARLGMNEWLQSLDDHVVDLQNQLTELANQSQQNNLHPTLLITEQIHASQVELIHFFQTLNEISKADWSEMTSQKNHLKLIGNIDSFARLSEWVSQYNALNPSLPMTIESVKKDKESFAIQFRLHLLRALSPLLNQMKNDDEAA